MRIRAERGVILAAGGFEKNQAMRARHQHMPVHADWSMGSPENTGDAIRMGVEIGAATELMEEAWWSPVVVGPGEERPRLMIMEKGFPASLNVNQRGERFMNEAAPYNDVVKNMYGANTPEAPTIPAAFIFDSTYRRKYPCGPMLPRYASPDGFIRKDGWYWKLKSM